MRKWYKPSTWAKSAGATETKSALALGLSEELGSFLMFGSNGVTPSKALRLYEQSTAVSIPINYIAESFASINPVLMRGTEVVRDHPVLRLLQKPSPYFTQDLFFEALAKYYLITGESFIVALGNVNREPVELQPVSTADVDVPERNGGLASIISVTGESLYGRYAIARKGNSVRYLRGNLAEIKQIRNFSTRDSSLLRGQSPLVSASSEVRQHIKGNTHNISILENGGRVSLVFHFNEDFDQEEFDQARERVNEQYGGASRAGAIGVTAGGNLDIKEMGVNNKDMDFANLQNMARQAVALQYKFPLPMLTTDASTMNNYKEAKMALYDDAVLPLADRLFGGLSDFLLPRFGLDRKNYRLSYDEDQITALKSRRNEELKLRKDLNIESTNELRALLGREPIQNGDVVLTPANMVPLGVDIFTDDNEPGSGSALLRDE